MLEMSSGGVPWAPRVQAGAQPEGTCVWVWLKAARLKRSKAQQCLPLVFGVKSVTNPA